MTATRLRRPALATAALGGVLVLVSAGQPRWSDQVGTSSGHAPAATALALVAIAGVGLLLIARPVLRPAVGVLVALAGVAIVLVDLRVGSGLVTESPVAPTSSASRTSWFWLTALGGALVALGGAVVAGTAHRWPGPRRSFETPADPAGGTGESARPLREDAWSALDRGEDPTR